MYVKELTTTCLCSRSDRLSPTILLPDEVEGLINRSHSFRGAKEEKPAPLSQAPPTTAPPNDGAKLSPPMSPTGGLAPPKSPKVTRTESLKVEKVKRTLSLRAVRHTPSFKDKYKLPTSLPPAEIEGVMERKQDLQSGGKRATIRSWKTFYTVLCGQLLCFFKDKSGVLSSVTCVTRVTGVTCVICVTCITHVTCVICVNRVTGVTHVICVTRVICVTCVMALVSWNVAIFVLKFFNSNNPFLDAFVQKSFLKVVLWRACMYYVLN